MNVVQIVEAKALRKQNRERVCVRGNVDLQHIGWHIHEDLNIFTKAFRENKLQRFSKALDKIARHAELKGMQGQE